MKAILIIMALIMSCVFFGLSTSQPGTGDQSTDTWYLDSTYDQIQPGCYIGSDGVYVKVLHDYGYEVAEEYYASRHVRGHPCGLRYWGAWENWTLTDVTVIGAFILN